MSLGSNPSTVRPATFRSISDGSICRPSAKSSVIWKKPAFVPGAGLVISIRICVVLTGSNVIVEGWLLAVASVTARLFTGTSSRPFQ